MSDLIERLRGLLSKATPGDLTSAQRHIEHEWVECPMCDGDGEVGAADYCNFDGVALGVQFYGIGKEFGAHEELWAELIKAAPNLLDTLEAATAREAELVAQVESLTAENERLRGLLDAWLGLAREHLDTEVAGRTFAALARKAEQ